MKIRLISALFLFIACVQLVCAQDSLTKVKIAEIRSIVNSIESDPSLKPKILNKTWSDTLQTGEVRVHPDTLGKLVAYYGNGILKKISLQYGLVFYNGGTTQYYFDNDQVIYMSDDATNSSRMGSCGTLDIHSEYFFNTYNIISSNITEEPFACYNLQKKTEDEIFRELAKLLERLK